MIESGQPLDEKMVDKLMAAADGSGKTSRKETIAGLKMAGTITMFVAPGLVLLGLFVGEPLKLIGVAALVLFVSFALFKVADSWDEWYGPEEGTEETAEEQEG